MTCQSDCTSPPLPIAELCQPDSDCSGGKKCNYNTKYKLTYPQCL